MFLIGKSSRIMAHELQTAFGKTIKYYQQAKYWNKNIKILLVSDDAAWNCGPNTDKQGKTRQLPGYVGIMTPDTLADQYMPADAMSFQVLCWLCSGLVFKDAAGNTSSAVTKWAVSLVAPKMERLLTHRNLLTERPNLIFHRRRIDL